MRAARAAFDEGRWSDARPGRAHAGDAGPGRPGRGARRRAGASSSRSTTASRSSSPGRGRALDGQPPALLRRLADQDRGRDHPVSSPDMHCYTRKEPVGVCGQIIPWNFPLLMAAWKLAPGAGGGLHDRAQAGRADAAHRAAPRRAGARGRHPRGRAQRGHRRRRARGAALVEHPGVDKIAFTGSTAVGREIGAKAGRALKRVTLELGGKSPNIILPDADLDAAIKGSLQAIYFNTGQACNAGSRLFVHKDQFDQVVAGLADAARARRVGPGLDPDTQLGPLVSAEQQERVPGYIEAGTVGGRRAGAGRRRARRRRRLLRRAHPVRRHQRRPDDRARGDLRPRAGGAALRGPRGGRPAGQRHATTAWPPASGRATWARPTGWPRCCAPATCT